MPPRLNDLRGLYPFIAPAEKVFTVTRSTGEHFDTFAFAFAFRVCLYICKSLALTTNGAGMWGLHSLHVSLRVVTKQTS